MEQGLVMAEVLEARGVAAAVTQRKAAVLVCEHALDLTDAGQLLDMLAEGASGVTVGVKRRDHVPEDDRPVRGPDGGAASAGSPCA